jgi:hypothetical protein
MKFKTIVAVGLLAAGVAGATLAADRVVKEEGDREVRREVIVKHRGHRGASVEFTAMHNIMAEMLSAKTGKTTAEIQALFEKGGPHEAFETLGIAEDEVRPMFKEARQQLISRAERAGLITGEQAEKLRTAKIEMRHKRRHGDDDDRRHGDDD